MEAAAPDVGSWLAAELQRNGDEESLMRAIASLCRKDPDCAWDILSQLDQFYRRGRIPAELFQAVKRRTEQLAVKEQMGMPAATLPTRRARVLRGRYELQELLGRGRLGTVYKALDRLRADMPVAEQHVAIKLLHATPQAGSSPLPELLREFHHAQSLAHPNIVRVHDVDRDGEQILVVMELLQGMTLQRLLDELPAHRLPVAQALAVIRDIGAALTYAHSRQLIHGDLQPRNVMVEFDSSLRVLDFGESRQWQRERWISGPFYSAGHSTATACDDLHALGCIAYELLSGERPFGRPDARQQGSPARPRGLTRRQWRALRSALASERARRPRSVAAWLGEMQLEQAAAALAPLSELLLTSTSRRARGLPWLPAGVAACVALAAPGVWWSRPAMHADVARWQASALTVMAPTNRQGSSPPAVVATPVSAARSAADPTGSPSSATSPAALAAPPSIQFAGESLTVAEDAAGAWIMVRRSGNSRGDIDFSWWTEPGTARPGVDYVAEGLQHARIADGQEVAQLFVPLIKDSARNGAAVFYVQIGSPKGAVLGGTRRSVVRLQRG